MYKRQTLDAKIIEEIRKLSADKETLAKLLTQTKKVISGSKEGYDAELALLREKHAETEERIKRLVESLSVASDTSAIVSYTHLDVYKRQIKQMNRNISLIRYKKFGEDLLMFEQVNENVVSAIPDNEPVSKTKATDKTFDEQMCIRDRRCIGTRRTADS